MNKLPYGTNYCKCAACGEYFNSVYAFDTHRAGKPGSRSCLTPAEMTVKGMEVSKRGYWVSTTLKNVKFG